MTLDELKEEMEEDTDLDGEGVGEKSATNCCSELAGALSDKTFLKPFIFLFVLFAIGYEWSSLLGTYSLSINLIKYQYSTALILRMLST